MSKSVKFVSQKSTNKIKSNKIIDSKTGKQVIVDTDVMHECGYFDLKDKTKDERIKILNEILKKMTPLKVFRILNYLAIVNKHHEQMHKIFLDDRDYVSTKLHPTKSSIKSVKSVKPVSSVKLVNSVKLVKSKSNKLPTVSVSKNQIKDIVAPILRRYRNSKNKLN
jgi:hypothetical protein